LGGGIIGGPVLSLRRIGREAAHVAVRILNGEEPWRIQIAPVGPGKPVYDWRELRRWHVREDQLPANSEVRFRRPSLFEAYRWHILGALGVLLVEAALIFALARQLRRRSESERALRTSEEALRTSERALRESAERMKLAADAADLGVFEWGMVADQIWALGKSGDIVRWAESGRSGFDSVLELVNPEDRQAVRDAVTKAVQGDGNYECVHRAAFRDGRVRWLLTRGRVEFNNLHEPTRMRGMWMDITARKEADDRAQESERRFVHLANSAPMLMWASGPDKLCTFFNQPWLQFTGRTLEEELGDGWTAGVHPDDLPGCLRT
jgi:PAS domain-containing protein